jgi:glycosyltransferase involved in cell wall biosynthesis
MNSVELKIVIPVYNEEEAIQKVLKKWCDAFETLSIHYEIHVYNDGSKDNTLTKLKEIANQYNRIIVHDKPNSGHGPTILKGYRENCDSPWLFQIDSDDELGPEAFEDLWNNKDKYDFLMGRRIERHSPLPRKLISMVSRFTVWLFYGRGIYDVNSPYRLMKSELYKEYFETIPADTFAPNVIIAGITCQKNFKIYEIPVKYNFRTTGEVSIKKWKLLKAAVKSFMQTIMYRIRYL